MDMPTRPPVWIGPEAGDFATFRAQVAQATAAADVPLAADVQRTFPSTTAAPSMPRLRTPPPPAP